MAVGKEYAVVLALRADDKTSSPLRAVGDRLKHLRGQMSAVGRDVGMHRVAGQFGALRGAMSGLAGMAAPIAALLGPLSILGAGLGVGGLAALAHGAAEAGDALGEMSERLGMGVESIQELQFAAMKAGVSNEQLETGLKELSKRIGQAVNGTGEAKDVFDALKIKLKDAAGQTRPTGDVLAELADKMKKIPNAAERAAVSAALLGKQGYMLAPMLAKGSEGLEDAAEEARKFGIITEAQAKAGGEFMDSMDNLGKAATGLRNAIGFGLLPVFQPLVDGLTDWIVANRDVMASGIGEFAAFLSDVFGAFASAVQWTVDAVGGLGPAFGMLATVFGPVLAALFPVTAAILAVAGLAFVVWKYWEPIKGFFIGLWDGVVGGFRKAIQSITGMLPDFLKEKIGISLDMPKSTASPEGPVMVDGGGMPLLGPPPPRPERPMIGPPPPRPARGDDGGSDDSGAVPKRRMKAAPAADMAAVPPSALQRAEIRIRLEAAPGTNARVVGQNQSGPGNMDISTDLNTGMGWAGG